MESDPDQLAYCIDRVLPGSSGQQAWSYQRIQSFSTQNNTGNYHPACIRFFCRPCYEGNLSLAISGEFCFPGRRRLFYVYKAIRLSDHATSVFILVLLCQLLSFAFDDGSGQLLPYVLMSCQEIKDLH